VLHFFLIGIASALSGQTFDVTPLTVNQGGVLRVRSSNSAESARMNGRVIRLFPQKEGGALGLMPVPAAEKPGNYKVELIDKNGNSLQSAAVTVQDAHFPTQNLIISEELSKLKPSPGETEAVAAFKNTVSDMRYWNEPFAAPVSGCLTSPFGVKRLHNGKPTGDYHTGFDQRSPANGPIRALAAGVVKIVREFNLHGGTIAIDHGQGVESIYLHMSKFATTEGAIVEKGDVIGYVGSTGRSTAPHLHWGVYVNGVAVNPAQWVQLHACAAKRKAPRTASKSE
jgi:murein DD-endopeptidase MepM/ murein hydrolase activator NlpD